MARKEDVPPFLSTYTDVRHQPHLTTPSDPHSSPASILPCYPRDMSHCHLPPITLAYVVQRHSPSAVFSVYYAPTMCQPLGLLLGRHSWTREKWSQQERQVFAVVSWYMLRGQQKGGEILAPPNFLCSLNGTSIFLPSTHVHTPAFFQLGVCGTKS